MSGLEKTAATAILVYGGFLHRTIDRIRQSLELNEIMSATVAEMRSFLATDRVKVYRFHPDGSGQVIAESLAQNRLPPLLNLNFPALDIPPSARELFIKARQRSIVDVTAQKIILSRVEHPMTTGDLTVESVRQQPLEEILQRPVDPCHMEYLTAMGVLSSLVVPIFHQGKLWGLLVSHHSQPQVFSETDLQIVQLIADQLSIAIAQSELLTHAREQVRRETVINQITTLLHSPRTLEEILQLVLERVVRAVQGSGGRLYLCSSDRTPASLYTCGDGPAAIDSSNPILLEDNIFWQRLIHNADSFSTANFPNLRFVTNLYQEPELKSVAWVFHYTEIRGILLLSLAYRNEPLGCLTIFKNAVDIEISWAGYWDKDSRQQRPRESFQLWREMKKSQSPQWNSEDIELVESLGIHLTMALMQNRLYQIQKHSLELDNIADA